MMKMTATTKGSARVIGNRLNRAVNKQIPFAASQALNDVGKVLLAVNKREMKRSFNKPVNYTLNAFYRKPARKDDLTMMIARKSKPAGKHYLEIQHKGGIRPKKAIETMMERNIAYGGIIQTIMPTKHSTTAKGAFSTAKAMEAIAGVRGTMPNRPSTRAASQFERAEAKFAKRKSGSPFYIVEPRNGKVGGINKKVGKRKSVRVFNFLDHQARYTSRYPFHPALMRNAKSYFPAKLKARLRLAYRTMRV